MNIRHNGQRVLITMNGACDDSITTSFSRV
ncbi:hypothetical protein C7450_1265 [Chelatococcus asaccharovorans]|uniref:Uncharacterized protein n=1 Tax=Chelatococcus asaccharovorans TaxID=28210 RepID=A0A2V3U1G7_9HYPH|nr:hypothetical protein C7450_1265 [Chelatococcus asaccharovorans]